MRKIASFVACSMLAFSLGFSFMPESFNLLIGWLGPVFGTSLRVIFSAIFVLFGDPFRFTTLLFLWITVGLICGLIVRRRLGSLSSAWLVYSAMFLVIIVSALRLFEVASNLGVLESPETALAILPPLPPGMTLGMILEAPVVNEVYSAMQGISFTSPSSLTQIMFTLMGSIIPNFVKNASILLFSSLAGCEAGKLIEKRLFRRRKINASGSSSSPEIHTSITRKKLGKLPSIFFLTLIISASALSLSATTVSKVAEDDSYYAEGIFAFATPDGTVYMASAFADSEISFGNIDLSSSEFSDALMGIFISHDTSADALPPILTAPTLLQRILPPEAGVPMELLQNLTRYYELIPKTIFLTVYVDIDLDTARRRADFIASQLLWQSDSFLHP